MVAQDSIMINVEARKTYFVRGDTTMGVAVARPKFTQVTKPPAEPQSPASSEVMVMGNGG